MQRRTCGQTNYKTGRYGNGRGKTRGISREATEYALTVTTRLAVAGDKGESRNTRAILTHSILMCYIMPLSRTPYLFSDDRPVSCGHFGNFLNPPPAPPPSAPLLGPSPKCLSCALSVCVVKTGGMCAA